MVSPGDYEDTQVLDSEPPSPPGDDDGDDGIDHDQHAVPLGDTLPLEDLTGETQALEDDLDCAAASSPEIDLWGETQVVDDYEETVVVGSDDKGRGEDDCKPCPDGQKDEEVVVCSDASTDEEGAGGDHVSSTSQFTGGSHQSNHGSVRKNCASVRAASLQFSSLAPGHNITPKITDPASTYFNNGTYNKGKNGAVGSQNGSNVGMEKWQNNTLDLTSLGTRAGELDLDHKIGNSQRCTQDYHRDETTSRISNARVKKLFNEAAPGWEETTSNADKVIAKADSSHLLISDYVVGGLSYVGSQEPGDQSQANALEIVNEFLLVNDVGSFQEFNTGKTDIVKSCPVSSAKGVQTLAIKADHRSSAGKAEIFDWIDSCEDEGGGEFFGKRKNALFEVRGRKLKSHGQTPKARHISSGIARVAVDKNGEKEGADPKTFLEMTSLTRSDSRLMLCNAPGNEKAHNSETKTKKNLFKSMDEPSNSKSLEQLLETTDVDGGEENIYDVGPDTQMAAEVMEALLHGSPVNYKMEDTHPVTRKVTENSTKGTRKKRKTSKNISAKKGTSTPCSEGFATSSKRRKILSAKSTSGIPDLSRKHSSNTRVKSSLVDSTVEKRGNGMVEGHLNTSSVNGNESSRSFEREKTSGAVDETFTKVVDNCLSSLTLNVQLSVNEELLPGEYGVYTSPVAHRTRHSRTVSLLKRTETSYTEGGKKKNGQIDVRTSSAVKREDQIVAEASAPVKPKRKGSDMVSDQTAVVGKEIKSHTVVDDSGEPHQEEPKIGSAVKYSLSYPKRKRTKHVISGDSYNNGNLSNPSVLTSAVRKTTVQPSTRGKSKQFVKSISEILASAKRKKRSVSALKASKNVGMPSVTGNLPTLSGVRMKSSVNSPSSKPTLAKDSTECSVRPVLHKAGSTDAADNGSMYFMTHSLYAEENVRLDESSKENVQLSELACTPPPKAIDAVSPVFMVQDPMRTPRNKSLSTSSIIRELIRLEASETSPTWKLKDSRRRKDMASVRVLFSHHLNDEIIKQQKKILARLGVPIASSMSEATHFVTDKFARTKNMLEAMALGKPVVTDMWLESCGQASCFIDERNYILRDAKKEKEIGFNMPVSLAQACRRPLLQGRRVFITPNAKPNRELISSLVKAAQGQPLERIGRFATKDDEVPDDLLVLSCEEDYAICKPLIEKGTKVFSSELILNGIVIQKLEYERHRLFLDHVKLIRSTIW